MSLATLPFNGSVAAGGETILVSKRLTSPFVLKEIAASFALGQDRTTQLRFFLSIDKETPASGFPSGLDILSLHGEDGFIVGDDERKILPFGLIQAVAGSYLKIYAINTDGFTHTIDAHMVIDNITLEQALKLLRGDQDV